MSRTNDELDIPLFAEEDSDKTSISGSNVSAPQVAVLEQYTKFRTKLDENKRKNLSHRFSINLLWCVLVVLCAIAITEYFVVEENEYIKELFDFFKYVATTLIGYLYASNKKEE